MMLLQNSLIHCTVKTIDIVIKYVRHVALVSLSNVYVYKPCYQFATTALCIPQ